jgi:dolichyl-phosphate-mannose--protein O-mannosyl transferase
MTAIASSEAESRLEIVGRPASWFAPTTRNLVLWGALVFMASLAAFLWGIQAAKDIYFDETWYVPAARTLLKTGEMTRQEHPALAKSLIAASIAMFGDNPLGWRALSALFGAITIAAVGLWSFALTRSLPQALWAAAITFFDQCVFVQARIAMLDIFLMAFGALALAFYTLSVTETRSPGRARGFALAMGVSLGLAAACKVSGFFLWAGLFAIRLLVGLLRLWRVRFDDPRPGDFLGAEAAPGESPLNTFLGFAAATFIAYFLAFLPQILHAGTPLEFFATHRRMAEILSGHSPNHPYMSLWYTWPALWRPVWYLFQVPGGDSSMWTEFHKASAIVGLANPVVVFAGEAAILVMIFRFVARRDRGALIVAVAFLSQFLPWAVNPKGLEFSYYYFPSVLCLGPALALALFQGDRGPRPRAALGFLALAGLAFAFFLPILAAGIGIGPDGFGARMWLSTWR